MALEKTKKDKTQAPENIKKTKRNKHPTDCVVKTKGGKYFTCPFCGSENLLVHGVVWCNICDYEKYKFELYSGWSFNKCPNQNRKDHIFKEKNGRKTSFRALLEEINVTVKTGVCPNCDKNNRLKTFSYKTRGKPSAWRSNFGKIACTRCSYRSE